MNELGTYPPSTSDQPPPQQPDPPNTGGSDSFADKYLSTIDLNNLSGQMFYEPPEVPRAVETGKATNKPEDHPRSHQPTINSAFGGGGGHAAVSGPEHGEGGDPCVLVPDVVPQFVPMGDDAPGSTPSTPDFTSGYLADAQPAPLLAAAIPVLDYPDTPASPAGVIVPTAYVVAAPADVTGAPASPPVVLELDAQNQVVVPTPDRPAADVALPSAVRPVDPNLPSFTDLARPPTVFEQRIAEGKPFTVGLAVGDVHAVWSTDGSTARLTVDPAAVHAIYDPGSRDVGGYRVHEGDTTYRLNRDGTVAALEADRPAPKVPGDTAVPAAGAVPLAARPLVAPAPVHLPGPSGEPPVRTPGFGPNSFQQPFVEPGTPAPATLPEVPGGAVPATAPAAESALGQILSVLGEVVGGAAVVIGTGAAIATDSHIESTAQQVRVDVVDTLQDYVQQENKTLSDAISRGDFSLIEEKAPGLWARATQLANVAPEAALRLFQMAYGITVEALVADLVSADPLLSEFIDHVGGPSREDFRGKGLLDGQTFEVTTRAAVESHKDPEKRPTYGENLLVLPYDPPW